MPLPYPSAYFLEISYQPYNDILVGRWLRPVTEAEARQGYDDLLAAAQPHQARYWLLDIRRRHRSAPATLAWLLGTYYNQLVRTLGPRCAWCTSWRPTCAKNLCRTAPCPSRIPTTATPSA
ncbi:hypothetical protein [Hymenobacter coccineus]|uniref:hypothetical protein n=1 Tax=Hymenobacter coccineus TaxID=1908235 RepID=UPI000F796908|nr:hypothetical protein [Hymenobacter coccineus]